MVQFKVGPTHYLSERVRLVLCYWSFIQDVDSKYMNFTQTKFYFRVFELLFLVGFRFASTFLRADLESAAIISL